MSRTSIKEVISFCTSDGNKFSVIQEAIAHQCVLDLKAWIYKLPSDISREIIAEKMMLEAPLIRNLLEPFDPEDD